MKANLKFILFVVIFYLITLYFFGHAVYNMGVIDGREIENNKVIKEVSISDYNFYPTN